MNEELLNVLVKMDFDDLDRTPDVRYKTIYHYTSPEGMLGILQPNGVAKLWFTRYDSLNDMNERKDIKESLKNYCDKNVKKRKLSKVFADKVLEIELSDTELITYPGNQPIISELNGEVDTWTGAKSVECDTYLCCFSEESDLLPMWNYYTKSRHYEGYSIGFLGYYLRDKGGFEKGYHIDIKRVIYTDSDKELLFDELLLPLNRYFLNGSDVDRHSIITTISSILNELQFVFKNSCFQHEKEIRAILRIPKNEKLPNCKQFDVRYRTNNGYIVPYIEYDVPANAIQQITIAPLLQKEISVDNVKQMLRQHGYCDIPVDSSKLPIRF